MASIYYFDWEYLWPDPELDWNPFFYEFDPVPDGPVHHAILRNWAASRKTITVAPRGGGKTKLNIKDMMLRKLSWPGYSFIYATSADELVSGVGETMLVQYRENERLLRDFGPEYSDEGKILRPKGAGAASSHRMRLANHSRFFGRSVASRQRGGRPIRYRLDDPEYDPTGSTSMQDRRDFLEHTLFRIIIPMVTQYASGVDWIGTYVSARHYLWAAMQVKDKLGGDAFHAAEDERFDSWSRVFVPAAAEQDGTLYSCWPEMWPATREERLEKAKTYVRFEEQISLEEIEREIGTTAFNAEYMGKPGTGDDQYFLLDDNPQGGHAWWLTEVDPTFEENPRASFTRIHWLDDENIEQSAALNEFLNACTIFMTGDTSHSHRATSDFKATALFAIAPKNTLFVLDLWAARKPEPILVRETLQMGDRWRAQSIHPEGIKEGITYFQQLELAVRTKASDAYNVTHLPKVKLLKLPNIPKTDKIRTLHVRFEHNKIKLPLFMRMRDPWRMLFNQILEFNPDLQDGGIAHDDCLDCLQMAHHVIRGRVTAPGKDDGDDRNPLQRLMDGETHDEMGNPIGLQVDWSQVPREDLQRVMEAQTNAQRDESHTATVDSVV